MAEHLIFSHKKSMWVTKNGETLNGLEKTEKLWNLGSSYTFVQQIKLLLIPFLSLFQPNYVMSHTKADRNTRWHEESIWIRSWGNDTMNKDEVAYKLSRFYYQLITKWQPISTRDDVTRQTIKYAVCKVDFTVIAFFVCKIMSLGEN